MLDKRIKNVLIRELQPRLKKHHTAAFERIELMEAQYAFCDVYREARREISRKMDEINDRLIPYPPSQKANKLRQIITYWNSL